MRLQAPWTWMSFLLLVAASTALHGSSNGDKQHAKKENPQSASAASPIASLANSSSSFVENRGQLRDTKGNPRPDIFYYTQSSNGARMFFGAGKISYVFSKKDSAAIINALPSRRGARPCAPTQPLRITQSLYRTDLNLVHANTTAEILRDGESIDYENFFLAQCPNGVTNVHSFSTLTYKNIYPNIDLMYRGEPRGVKYDFVVRPGGNVSDIQLQYVAAENILLNADGTCRVTTPLGFVDEGAPFTYQNVKSNYSPASDQHNKKNNFQEVSAAYRLDAHKNILSFDVGAYDHTQPLIIDPALLWSTFFGGSGSEGDVGSMGLEAAAVDAHNNIIINGTTSSNDFPASPGAYQQQLNGSSDAYVAKFSPTGARLWATYFGGSDNESCGYETMAVDRSGNVIIDGFTFSNDLPVSVNAFQNILRNGWNLFVAKFDSNGALQWSTYYGGDNNRIGNVEIVCDPQQNVIVLATSGDDFPVSANSYQPIPKNSSNPVVIKFDPNGNRLWGTFFGGSDIAEADCIASDSSGNLFVSGATPSLDFPITAGAFQSTINNKFITAYLFKLSPAGQPIWSTFYGGDNNDVGFSCAVGTNNKVFMAGSTSSDNFPVTAGAMQTTFAGGNEDAFLVAFDSAGNRLWGTYCGGSHDDQGGGVSANDSGLVVITGLTRSPDFPVTADAYMRAVDTANGSAYIVEFDDAGNRIWSTTFGSRDGKGYTSGDGVALDYNGDIILSGCTGTSGSDFPITPGAFQSNNNGNIDLYVAKFRNVLKPIIASQQTILTNTLLCGSQQADSFYLHNTGNAPLDVSAGAFNGNAQNFSLLSPTTFPLKIAPGDSQLVIVAFSSLTAGTFATTLRFASNDTAAGHNPWLVNISVRREQINFSLNAIANDTIDFGKLECGNSKDTTFQLAIATTIPTTLALNINAGAVFSTVPSVFASANLSQSITVHCSSPAQSGKYIDSLMIADTCGDVSKIFFVVLINNNVLQASVIQDTAICPGDAISRTITIYNPSLDSQRVVLNGDAPFTITPDTLFLAPQQSATATINFPGSIVQQNFLNDIFFNDTCGIRHDVIFHVNVRIPQPVEVSLMWDSVAPAYGVECYVYLIAQPDSDFATSGFSCTIVNDSTALFFDSLTAIIPLNVSGNGNTVFITSNPYFDSVRSDTIAVLHYLALFGVTDTPKVYIKSLSTTNTCQALQAADTLAINFVPRCDTHSVAVLPFASMLQPVFPNPSTDRATIHYTTQEQAHVALIVRDALGQIVCAPVDALQSPGEYQTTINTRAFASGIYFVEMNAGSFAMVREMFVVR